MADLEAALERLKRNPKRSAIAVAREYREVMQTHALTQGQLSNRVGISRSAVANAVRLLELPDELLAMIEHGEISAGHGKLLVNRPDAVALARQWAERKVSVSEAGDVVALRRQAYRFGAKKSAVAVPRQRQPADIPDYVGAPVVYFLAAGVGGPIKIGTTTKLRVRAAQIQSGCANRLILLGLRKGGRILESAYHARFRRHRMSGEWFQPAAEILSEAAKFSMVDVEQEAA